VGEANQQPCRHPLRSYLHRLFSFGTTVTLTAVASQGSFFADGLVPARNGSCRLTMNANQSLMAAFIRCRPSMCCNTLFSWRRKTVDWITTSVRCALIGQQSYSDVRFDGLPQFNPIRVRRVYGPPPTNPGATLPTDAERLQGDTSSPQVASYPADYAVYRKPSPPGTKPRGLEPQHPVSATPPWMAMLHWGP